MHGKARSGAAPLGDRIVADGERTRPDAMTWVDRDHAIVARTTTDGDVDVVRFPLPHDAGGRAIALADVVHAIGARRVIVMGDEPDRTALEREYVTVFRRPDLIVDEVREGPVGTTDLAGLLREAATR